MLVKFSNIDRKCYIGRYWPTIQNRLQVTFPFHTRIMSSCIAHDIMLPLGSISLLLGQFSSTTMTEIFFAKFGRNFKTSVTQWPFCIAITEPTQLVWCEIWDSYVWFGFEVRYIQYQNFYIVSYDTQFSKSVLQYFRYKCFSIGLKDSWHWFFFGQNINLHIIIMITV